MKTFAVKMFAGLFFLSSPAFAKAGVKRSLKTKPAAVAHAKSTAAAKAKASKTKSAKLLKAAPKKKLMVASYSPTSGTHERAQINFNGLISKTDARKSKLERRVKMKTASREDKSDSKPGHIGANFEDSELKWKTPARQPQLAAGAPVRRSSQASAAPFELTMRSKSK